VPATPVSPVSLALKIEEEAEKPNAPHPPIPFCGDAAAAITERSLPAPLWDPLVEQDEAERLAIEREFSRKLAALRRLPRRERSAALRVAREERQLALRLLKEKRARERHAEYQRRRQRLALG
jgi:hypothetical protein